MMRASAPIVFSGIVRIGDACCNAETRAALDPHTDTTGTQSNRAIQPDQVCAGKMIGSSLYDVQNRKIRSVQDLVLDKDGKVASVVVDVGSFLGVGGKNIAVGIHDLKTDSNRLTLDRAKEQLQQMAEYRLEDRNTGPELQPRRQPTVAWVAKFTYTDGAISSARHWYISGR
ncbi:MAG: PRC-barrel domain-containing protein [Alphaproteobacteria bacterium]|nr:PRC-barrel domain-containing protein [Alphaproteobacteria bacterium]